MRDTETHIFLFALPDFWGLPFNPRSGSLARSSMASIIPIWCLWLALGISGAWGGVLGLEGQAPETYQPSHSDPVTRYGHDAAGRIVLTVLPNGCVTRQVRDSRGWLMSTTTLFQANGTTNALRSMADYTQPHKPGTINGYDAVGNVCKVREGYHALPARDVVNVYDHTYRLTAERRVTYQAPLAWNAVASDELDRYQYDAANNRTLHQKFTISGGIDTLIETKTYLSGTPQLGYNTNQLVSVTTKLEADATEQPHFSLHFTYDANGNRQTKTSKTGMEEARQDVLSYDQRNRLISVDLQTLADSNSVGLHSYRYDYRGRRTSTTTPESGPGGIGFSFAGGNYVQEFDLADASGPAAVEIVRGADLVGGIGGILYTEARSGG